MITPVAFYQEPTTTGAVLNRILVSTATSATGSIALYKYDSDGNVLVSRTYAETLANTNWRPKIIYSESDDDNFYYSVGDQTNGRAIKWNASDLTIATFSIQSNGPRIMPLGASKNYICIASSGSLQFLSKTTMSATGSSFTLAGANKSLILVSQPSELVSDLIAFSSVSGTLMGRFTFSTTNYGLNKFENIQTDANFESGVLIREDNTFLLASPGYIYNVSNGSISDSTADAGAPILQLGLHRFSNGDILIIESGAFRRRTLANVKANSTTNVWSVSVSTIVAGMIDDLDNIYIVLNATTNGFRKYNSSGTLVWQQTLAANGYGIGIAHK